LFSGSLDELQLYVIEVFASSEESGFFDVEKSSGNVGASFEG
jgi:hypothetical protein